MTTNPWSGHCHAATANAVGVANSVARIDHVHAIDTAVVVDKTTAQALSNKTLTTPVMSTGCTASGAGTIDFSGSTAAFKTPTGLETHSGKQCSTATVNLIADPGNAGAISVVNDGVCALTTAGAETRTLAIPAYIGQRITLSGDACTGNCVVTVATAFDSAAHTTITVATGKAISLVGVQVGGLKCWRLVGNDGTTLG